MYKRLQEIIFYSQTNKRLDLVAKRYLLSINTETIYAYFSKVHADSSFEISFDSSQNVFDKETCNIRISKRFCKLEESESK